VLSAHGFLCGDGLKRGNTWNDVGVMVLVAGEEDQRTNGERAGGFGLHYDLKSAALMLGWCGLWGTTDISTRLAVLSSQGDDKV
jgi:hypothetical protein